ncbi:uncharacterized protein LOC107043557 [Diachasma alloeum]|uniref:uncharacterized protein LOC107043557 n=1 Tax=Diachasma alloeum TaxID=454923 RepID=UPI00073819BE|nr:uncharacterized protein LOC107043557 [Diachasma alloeum]
MILLKIMILIVMWNSVSAIIGYDCGSNALNVTTISLLDIDDCDIEDEEVTTSKTHIYMIQLDKYTHTRVLQCKIEVSRTVYHCGMHSHVSIVDNAHAEYIQYISEDACKVAHDHGTITIGNTLITGLQPNTTTTRSVTLAGTVNNDGRCDGVQYSDPFDSYKNVVVLGVVRISLRSDMARVEVDNGKIYLSSGHAYRLRDNKCIDPIGGYSFWETLPSTSHCETGLFSILHKGLVNKITSRDDTLYSVNVKEVSFTFTKQGVDNACGLNLIKTEHPKIFIIETSNIADFSRNVAVSLNTDNMDLLMYVNAKFVYVERYIRSQVHGLYRDVLRHQCNLEREILRNSLAIASTMPDEFAFRFMKGPGYMAVLAGEVIHLVQCVPVELKVRKTEECYNRLPVQRGNESVFLTPCTHVVVTQATQIPCNSPLLQFYRLADTWYKLMPHAIEMLPPIQIKPNVKVTWKYQNPSHLATSGIYSEEGEHSSSQPDRPKSLK